MGRWKKWRSKKRCNKTASGDDDEEPSRSTNNRNIYNNDANNNLWFHWRTREDLLRYLEEYREGCWSFYHRVKLSELEDDPTNDPTTEAKAKQSANADPADPKQRIVIGAVAFPPLTDTVFMEPCLKLPAELTKKQRVIVHQCCVEKDLFHDSFAFGDDRSVAISIYADGFDGLPKTPFLAFDAHRCKPWYCRRDGPGRRTNDDAAGEEKKETVPNAMDEEATPSKSSTISSLETPIISNTASSNQSFQARAEEEAVKAIYSLIDQPGDCIRDGHDVLVYEELEGASLAGTEPPSPDNHDRDWMLVDSASKMKLCVQELTAAKPTEIAFDLEASNVNKYTQLTCLLQVTSNVGKEYIIDALAPGVWDEVHGLAPLFADPAIVKIGHSTASLDVRSLHRDFGIFVVNLFDTYEAARALGFESLGLVAVCMHYGLRDCDTYLDLKHAYQSCDWRVRPLTQPMIQYARYDVHYLIQLRWLMMRDMVQKVFWDSQKGVEVQAEERLVAESLSQTLAQIELAEEDALVEEENNEAFKTPEKKQRDILTFLDEDEMEGNSEDDDFKTAVDFNRSEDDTFYTPGLNSRNMSFLDDSFEKDDNEGALVKKDITAADLRLQPVLMKVVSISQERSRTLWNSSKEQHRNNALFQSIIKRAERRRVVWEDSSTDLYDELCQWRQSVAEELECLPGFVAPLDFLVAVAWKRPTTELGLRRINTRLPSVLEQYPKYREQLLDRVLRCSLKNGGVAAGNVVFYSQLNIDRGDQEQGIES